MRRLVCLAVLVVAAVPVAAASADPPAQPETIPQAQGHGIVPTWAAHMANQFAHGAYRATYGYGQLRNHGGATMTTNTTYALYWNPSNYGSATGSAFQGLVNQYFTDVAADSGKQSNVYYTETQYSGIKYQSTFAGALTDNDPMPASGCTDSATSTCISDAQLQTELKNYLAAHPSLPRGPLVEYFVFFAPGVGSCLGSSGCAFTDYCAYHSSIGTGSSAIIYANQPYVEGVSGCDANHHPNAAPGDAVLNVVSHEHNESITDEYGNAWYDLFGYEDGDKCAWSWGSPTGSGTTAYNQIINGNHYMLQLEYSNYSRGCVMTGL